MHGIHLVLSTIPPCGAHISYFNSVAAATLPNVIQCSVNYNYYKTFVINAIQRIRINYLAAAACMREASRVAAATDTKFKIQCFIFPHSPVHESWNSINVDNNSRLECLQVAIIRGCTLSSCFLVRASVVAMKGLVILLMPLSQS